MEQRVVIKNQTKVIQVNVLYDKVEIFFKVLDIIPELQVHSGHWKDYLARVFNS